MMTEWLLSTRPRGRGGGGGGGGGAWAWGQKLREHAIRKTRTLDDALEASAAGEQGRPRPGLENKIDWASDLAHELNSLD